MESNESSREVRTGLVQGLPSAGHGGVGGWEPRKKKEELEGVSRTAGVTDQEAGGRERRGNASQQILCFAIFR